MESQRKFLHEYEREAVRRATQSGVTKRHVASELGINPNLRGRWCKDFAANGSAAFPGQGTWEELRRLRRSRSPSNTPGHRPERSGEEDS